VYLSESGHNVDFGWNSIARVRGCRGLQEHVNVGPGYYDLHIHDNVIHDTQCDGIVMTTLNPSAGTVELYNNIIYNTGQGPANAENSGTWSCMDIQGWQNSGVNGENGIIHVYNNTMYACGTWASPPYSGSSGGVIWSDGNTNTKGLRLDRNIIQLTSGPTDKAYVISACRGDCDRVTGANNVLFGGGGTLPKVSLAHSIFADPLFVNASAGNFHLLPGSPARGRSAVHASLGGEAGDHGSTETDAGALQFGTP
jgi:hypothetical protein